MAQELISKSARNEVREILKRFILSQIDMFFEAAGLSPDLEFDPGVSGQRRTLVEQYYKNIDFSSVGDAKKFLLVVEEMLLKLQEYQEEDWEKKYQGIVRRFEREGIAFVDGRFETGSLAPSVVDAPTLVNISEESMTEHLEKIQAKILSSDYAGAISNSYTLVEEFLKELLRKTGTEFKETDGDIRSLYKLVSGPMNLNPSGDNLEKHLKSILTGLQSQIAGLYEVANKASDRHARKYKPAKRHAKLAANVALTMCEFLLESYDHQFGQSKGAQKASD